MLTAQGVSHIVIPVPGRIVTQALYVQLTYVVSDPLTELSRCWSLWLHCRGKVRRAMPLCLHYSIACTDKCILWLSSNRTAGLSLEGFACATKWFAYLTDDPPSSTQMDGPCVHWQCWWGAFYVGLPYPAAVYCQNMKRYLTILRCTPCWPSTLLHSSHIS